MRGIVLEVLPRATVALIRWLSLTVGLSLILMGTLGFTIEIPFVQRARETVGTVKAAEAKLSRGYPITFTTHDRQTVRGVYQPVLWQRSAPKQGDSFVISYDPDDTQRIEKGSAMNALVLPTLFFAFGIVFVRVSYSRKLKRDERRT